MLLFVFLNFSAKTDLGTEPISFLFTYFWNRFKALIPYFKYETIFLYLFITLSNLKKTKLKFFNSIFVFNVATYCLRKSNT